MAKHKFTAKVYAYTWVGKRLKDASFIDFYYTRGKSMESIYETEKQELLRALSRPLEELVKKEKVYVGRPITIYSGAKNSSEEPIVFEGDEVRIGDVTAKITHREYNAYENTFSYHTDREMHIEDIEINIKDISPEEMPNITSKESAILKQLEAISGRFNEIEKELRRINQEAISEENGSGFREGFETLNELHNRYALDVGSIYQMGVVGQFTGDVYSKSAVVLIKKDDQIATFLVLDKSEETNWRGELKTPKIRFNYTTPRLPYTTNEKGKTVSHRVFKKIKGE